MGKTTFTGPIRAGNIINTSGTTLGKDVKNVGSVVMAQTYSFTQAGSAAALATPIVLPANSHILSIQMATTAAWSGAALTMSVGISVAATELSILTAIPVGITPITPLADATKTAIWDDTGTTDDRIWVKSANTGTGVGTISVRYVQAQDLA
jgi:hypothetical protein